MAPKRRANSETTKAEVPPECQETGSTATTAMATPGSAKTKEKVARATKKRQVSLKPKVAAKRKPPMPENPKSREAINELLKAHGIKEDQLCKLSRCVMAGIDRGFVEVLPPEKDPEGKFGLDQVIVTGNCLLCDKEVTCLLKDVLFQPDYGGNDYEDGGVEATLHCPDEECIGLYVSDICAGRPSIGCGKFHNHCEVCPEFGQCLGDYREAHCKKCGNHYFCGLQGFPCNFCRPKKSKAFKWF